MEKDILRAVVEVEREIQDLLVEEQRQSEERLAQVRRECTGEIEQEKARLQDESAITTADARWSEAQRQATAVVATTTAQAERFGRFDDEYLRRWIQRELLLVVPGKKP